MRRSVFEKKNHHINTVLCMSNKFKTYSCYTRKYMCYKIASIDLLHHRIFWYHQRLEYYQSSSLTCYICLVENKKLKKTKQKTTNHALQMHNSLQYFSNEYFKTSIWYPRDWNMIILIIYSNLILLYEYLQVIDRI